MEEVIVRLADGCTLCSGSENRIAGDYVRLCDPDGEEIAYWDHLEWQEDPILVMGAIIQSAAGVRIEKEGQKNIL